MDHISINAIRHFVEIHSIIVYFVIFFGVLLEGEIVVIFAGIFSYLGSLNIFVALLAVILGGITKSFLGYTFGAYLRKQHADKLFLAKMERRITYFLPRFSERPFWSIFVSRFFILGIGWFTLIYSGFKEIPVKTYIKAEGYSLAIWSVGVIALGHFFGYTALSINHDVRNFLLVILICFILFFILEKIVAFLIELFEM